MKLLEENTRKSRCLCDGNEFLDKTLKALSMKKKKLDFIKTKDLGSAKDTVERVKIQGENLCRIHI